MFSRRLRDSTAVPSMPASCSSWAGRGRCAERRPVLPHPQVAELLRQKAADHDRWIAGMRRLQRSLTDDR